ncbi:hypothetical protein K2F54_17615 [Cryobacterium sp. 1639]|uniref:hypothetical protein n=1 Tax=Cryobacterium inferilacus TaxID=2866629 RepID=UPI001C72B434|nr:hypothetical protein [Cryobacterium sp. 1639]MBX0301785.1 hypothetical protein [Cryobacterium sp. 1639]
MTNTTPPEGTENHNPDAPTEHLHPEHTDAENVSSEQSAAEPTTAETTDADRTDSEPATSDLGAPGTTTVADPSAPVDAPAGEPVFLAPESNTPTAVYTPGEPIDGPIDTEPAVDRNAPTEKVERLSTTGESAPAESAHAEPTHTEPTHAEAARDEAIAQKKDYTPDYVPAPVVVPSPAVASQPVGQPAAQAAPQPTQQYTQQQPSQQFAPTPIYVTAPTAPKKLGNRAVGILIGLIATAVFAGIYALVAFFISAAGAANIGDATARFTDFLVLPVFYVPVIFFFLAFALLVAVLNRAGWWAYVLGGFLVAIVVYFSYIGGALLAVQAWTLTASEASRFISTQWLNPGAIAAAIMAREVPIWFGAWIARRGRSVTAKNAAAREEYERQLAEGPQLAR